MQKMVIFQTALTLKPVKIEIFIWFYLIEKTLSYKNLNRNFVVKITAFGKSRPKSKSAPN